MENIKPVFKNRPNTEHYKNSMIFDKFFDFLFRLLFKIFGKTYKRKTVWFSRSVALDGIILACVKGEIYALIEKRSDTMMDQPGKWCVPCGYLDWDENGWDALTREVFEETSFYIPDYQSNLAYDNNKQPFFINTDTSSNRQNVALNYCVIYDFEELPRNIEYFKNDEIAEIKWIPVSEVPAYNLIFNHDERIMMAIKMFEKVLIEKSEIAKKTLAKIKTLS